jgi:hypothetical protein
MILLDTDVLTGAGSTLFAKPHLLQSPSEETARRRCGEALNSSGGVFMRKVLGLTAMVGLLVLSLGSRPSSALTPAQQACLNGCIARDRSCSLNCSATQKPGCQTACNTELTACRQACLA